MGGTQVFWETMGFTGSKDYRVTLLNLHLPEVTLPNFSGLVGDAANLDEFSDKEFDVVFSNSVIEHLGNFQDQQQMARQVQRVGKLYFVQTPNRFFPVEPHFLLPFFQFFPLWVQVELIRRFDLGWYEKIPDKDRAREHVLSHRLLTEREMVTLFPEGQLYKERFFGMTKSFIAYGTLPRRSLV